jgi:hypothetical protein
LTGYKEVDADWFVSVTNFHSAIHMLVEKCEQITKRMKMESKTALDRFLNGTEINVDDMFQEASRLMKLCDRTNNKDIADFWPSVSKAFVRFTVIREREFGADAVLHSILSIKGQGLEDNISDEGIEEITTHVFNTLLATEPIIEVLFSDDAWHEIQDAWPRIYTARRDATEVDLEQIIKYMDHRYRKATSTISQGFAIFKRMICVAIETGNPGALEEIRSKLGKYGAISTVVKAFASVHDVCDAKGYQIPTPMHPLEMIQQGCLVSK